MKVVILLVAQGYSQKFGEDYDLVFAPVVKHATLRVFLSIGGARNMIICQYDIKTAFLHGTLQNETATWI